MLTHSVTQDSNRRSLLQEAYKNDLMSTVEEKPTKCQSATQTKPPLVSTAISEGLGTQGRCPRHRQGPRAVRVPPRISCGSLRGVCTTSLTLPAKRRCLDGHTEAFPGPLRVTKDVPPSISTNQLETGTPLAPSASLAGHHAISLPPLEDFYWSFKLPQPDQPVHTQRGNERWCRGRPATAQRGPR